MSSNYYYYYYHQKNKVAYGNHIRLVRVHSLCDSHISTGQECSFRFRHIGIDPRCNVRENLHLERKAKGFCQF